MVHWETIKFCRVLNNFEFINWIEISFSFYYFILSKLTFYKIKYLGWNTFDFLNYSFLLFFFVWVDLVKETEEKPHRGQSFIVKRGLMVQEDFLEWQQRCAEAFFKCLFQNAVNQWGNLAKQILLTSAYSPLIQPAKQELSQWPEETVMDQFPSNFNVHMTNREILTK